MSEAASGQLTAGQVQALFDASPFIGFLGLQVVGLDHAKAELTHFRNYLTASLDFQIARGFSVGYAFKRGEDAPTFLGVNRMALTIGIGFGR